ncbi:hypothetical protein OGAPHI_003847 [Ogataea philodendri]|uniref:RRM domain-containing protein n=1 Tax=Ogataea philodendri TaxID=1378263 RepID=A0A9P8T4W0_9ASCO|nr:uncharacterized protein OGAPHI_003847 [Ogataea philodendri]KAH3665659.1 hypothetical protein OGAPHI_003847 [Ogataea philodendri]
MNKVRKIQQLNEKELELGASIQASWHYEYADTSYIFIGNLPPEINEMDLLIVFSQYGVPTHLKLMRDKETGQSRRFAFLKYEQFESTILAVDNLNGYSFGDEYTLRVDHVRYRPYSYDKDQDANRAWDEALAVEMEKDFGVEQEEPEKLLENEIDAEDPMAQFLAKKHKSK